MFFDVSLQMLAVFDLIPAVWVSKLPVSGGKQPFLATAQVHGSLC
jgi:hypothetical protein